MQSVANNLGFLGLVGAFLFPLWPLILATPLTWRRGNVLNGMGMLWAFTFVGWLLARRISPESASFLIPEPLNTQLFLAAGVAVVIANVVALAGRRGRE